MMGANPTTYLTVSQDYRLNAACMKIAGLFGPPYLVGSVLTRPDFHDVDVREMLDDELFARLFPDRDWLLMVNAVFSLWLSEATGLPIDFQFQDTTNANAENDGYRHALGMRMYREPLESPLEG